MFIPRFEGLPYGFSRSYDLCSIDQCSSQLSNKCVLTVFVQLLQKFGQIHFLEKFTQVSDPDQSCPTCLISAYY